MINQVTIIGVGLIGGSLAQALKSKNLVQRVVGISQAKTIKQAQTAGLIDEGFSYQELAGGIAGADIIFLCTPIKRIIALIGEIAVHKTIMHKHVIITDVGSTKASIVAQAQKALAEYTFIGGHPMAGSEKSGVGAADPYLFENAIYVLTPPVAKGEQATTMLAELLQGIGARVILMSAAEHDKTVAGISHLPQMIAVALVNLIEKQRAALPEVFNLAAGGFKDLTRIASSPYNMWADIKDTNGDNIQRLMENFISELSALKSGFKDKQFQALFESANHTRAALPVNNKGFISPLYDILVTVKDEPGVIARMSAALNAQRLNINDIEVLKVREGEGGSIRMAFKSQHIAEQAVAVLAAEGFQAKTR